LGDQLDLFSLGSLALATPGAGSVNLFELSLDTVSDLNDLQAPDFILAKLSFDPFGIGISPLTFSATRLRDGGINGDRARLISQFFILLLAASTQRCPCRRLTGQQRFRYAPVEK
jgi:hypothetical protein